MALLAAESLGDANRAGKDGRRGTGELSRGALGVAHVYFLSSAHRDKEWAWKLLQYLGGKTKDGEYTQAVNLAKEYCGADAPGFVNGILGAIHREMGHNPAQP